MLKANTLTSPRIALIALAVLLVIVLGVVTHTKLPLVGPNNQISTLHFPNVMHADTYWSPIDECSDAGSADCHKANIPSLQSSLDVNRETTILKSDSRHESDQSSAYAATLSGNNLNSWNFCHCNGNIRPPITK